MVGMVCRPPRKVATATCPTAIRSPHFPGDRHAKKIHMVAIVHCNREGNVDKLFNMLIKSFGKNRRTGYID